VLSASEIVTAFDRQRAYLLSLVLSEIPAVVVGIVNSTFHPAPRPEQPDVILRGSDGAVRIDDGNELFIP
jgi:hypothetical protein